MTRRTLRAAGRGFMVCFLFGVPGHVLPATDGAASGAAGEAACAECHGATGLGGGAVPRLAGLPAGYIAAQLRAFAQGTRENAAMASVARGLDAVAIDDLALRYAALPPTPDTPAHAKDEALVARGERVALRGDWAKGLPPCASCHGRRGLGVGAAFPPLAGQPAAYLAGQIAAWNSGGRHDDPLGLMRSVAGRLDQDTAAAVAAYYETLPPSLPTTEGKP